MQSTINNAFAVAMVAFACFSTRLGAVIILAGLGMLSKEQTMQRGRQWKTPEDLYMSGVAVNPWSYKLHYSLATALGEKQDAAGMYAELQEALALEPGYIPSLRNAGLTTRNLGRHAEAKQYQTKALAAIKRAPADDPYTTPAQVAAAHNDMVSFLLPRAKERLVGLADKRNDAVAGLANKSGATGNQAVQKAGNKVLGCGGLCQGVIEAELGDVNAARAHFLLAVKADPNHEAAKNLRLLRG
ncbi:hypothetical protein CYMTET_49992 [Cymbomonas tetramitiformis]|uniref:Tetratricopeptide repeat protein n=1 Tax=Cymbomonas tetramitiformis TaxID=36881 RepID=A0AAE0BP35_9CHLO|nr:hypothetical protein CYMTET_49992 [Cymbomonas tetramitiformis]